MDFGCTLVFMPPNSNSNSREPNEHEHLLEQEGGLAIPTIGNRARSGVGDRHAIFLPPRHFIATLFNPQATESSIRLHKRRDHPFCMVPVRGLRRSSSSVRSAPAAVGGGELAMDFGRSP